MKKFSLILVMLLSLMIVASPAMAHHKPEHQTPPGQVNKPAKPNANKPAKPHKPHGDKPSKPHKPSKPQGSHGNGPAGKITICHATGSATNPFVTITISVNGLHGHGHHAGDIIPAPAAGCPKPSVPVTPPAATPNNPPADTVTPPATTPDKVDKPVEAEKPDGSTKPEAEDKGAVSEFLSEPVGNLPFTGQSLLLLALLGAAAVAAGLYFYRNR